MSLPTENHEVFIIKVLRDEVTNELWPSTAEIAELLHLTGNRPIVINWLERPDFEGSMFFNPLTLQKYFVLFLSALHRWKEVHLWAPYIPVELFWSGRPIGMAPLLELVHLTGPAGFDIPICSQDVSEIWRHSPRFHTYTIEQFHEHTSTSYAPRHCRPGLPPPYANFTSIHLDNVMSVMECIEVLYAAEKLVHCRFGNVSGPKPPQARFAHTTLQSLYVASNFADHDSQGETYLHHIFDTIRAPALRRLSVECDDNWKHATFMEFFAESQFQLEALEFNMVQMWELELQEILWCSPKLRVLKIHGDSSQYPPPMSNTVIDRLTYKGPDTDNMICLELEFISMNDDALIGVSDGAFSWMICSRTRMAAAARLERVWFALEETDEKHQGDIQSLNDALVDDPSCNWVELVIHTQMSDWDYLVREKLWPSQESIVDYDSEDD